MTIKEIETLSGMSRANIRYYEAEGFLSPERRENGYRDYSQEDLETLKRIRLLRLLGVSLADIRAAKEGELPLEELMGRRLSGIARERTELAQAESVCRELRETHVRYGELDAQRYLDRLAQSPGWTPRLPAQDVQPRVTAPIRRFLARVLDYLAYTALWGILLAGVFRVNLSVWEDSPVSVLDFLVILLLMNFLEPLLLRVCGTTLGKWVLGLSVTDGEEGRLPYRKGLARVWRVFLYGYGLGIPILRVYRLWKSCRACDQVEELPWEEDSALRLREGRALLRAAGFAAACVVLVGGLAFSSASTLRPVHRGEITVAEFCENYNRFYESYYLNDAPDTPLLNPDGTWAKAQEVHYTGSVQFVGGDWGGSQGEETPEGSYAMSIQSQGLTRPELRFTEENGRMTGLTMTFRQEGDESFFVPVSSRVLATIAFVQAQPGVGIFDTDALNQVLDRFTGQQMETNFQVSANGVTVLCKTRCEGYYDATGHGMMLPEKDAETHQYTLEYTMTLETPAE